MTADIVLQALLVLGTWVLAGAAIWGKRIAFLLGLGPHLILSPLDPPGELVTETLARPMTARSMLP